MGNGFLFLRNALVSLLLFGLFIEWLRPFVEMAVDVHSLQPFAGAIAFFLVIDAARVRGVVALPLKLLFTIGWVGYWFQPEVFASGDWWVQFAGLAVQDVRSLAAGSLAVSAELRTFLFLAGWAALTYSVHRIAVDRGHALWFVTATLVFLVLLQLWPGLDTGMGVLRAAGMGMLLLTLVHGTKWERLLEHRFPEGKAEGLSRVLTGVLCGALVFGLGYGLSAGKESKPEPVSLAQWSGWVESVAARHLPEVVPALSSVDSAGVSGYGQDDSLLGHRVTPDDSVAFVAVAERPVYYRGDSRDVYTGRGWRSSGQGNGAEMFQAARAPEGTETLTQHITVVSRSLSQTVFAGGPIFRFTSLTDVSGAPLSDIHIRFDADDDSYYIGTNGVQLASYEMETALPANDPADLLADVRRGAGGTDPSQRYLQLPDSLPERVKQLARSITAGVPEEQTYRRVAAIQSYLQEHYRYTLDTEAPEAGKDFVDTFLFETGEGYCNHFSTAMVVLLRSIGIEARWVKGFAPGTPDPDEPNTYMVRQSDAHSWVEVRFANAGWVPFEATPSAGAADSGTGGVRLAALASAPANMQLPGAVTPGSGASGEGGRSDAAPAMPAAEERLGAPASWLGAVGERLRELPAEVDGALETLLDSAPVTWLPLLGWGGAGVVAAAVLALALYAAARLLLRVRHGLGAGDVPPGAGAPRRVSAQQRRLDRLWRRIYRRHGKRLPSETLRDYAARLPVADSPEARAALVELIRYDEAVRYGGGAAKRVSHRWFDDVWRGIANK